MDLDALISLAKKLADIGELTLGPKPSAAAIMEVEAAIGRRLPPSYVRFLNEVGPFGGTEEANSTVVYSGDHRQLWGPEDALAKSKALHVAWGASGSAAKRVNEGFFFMQWMRPWQTYGFDAAGAVRTLRSHRPGTMVRVSHASFEVLLSELFGELLDRSERRGVLDTEALGVESTKLTLDCQTEGALESIHDSVEHLYLWNLADGKALAPLAKLPELRILEIYAAGDDALELPDALFLAPKLERIELDVVTTKRYSRSLNGLLKWMREAPVPPKERGFYVRLLADEPALEETASTHALLGALDCPNDAVAKTALRLLGAKLEAPKSLKGMVVALAGKSETKFDALSTQLAKVGARLDKRVGEDTTHVLLGVQPKAMLKKAIELELPLVHEHHLRRVLDAKGARFLTQKATAEGGAEQLRSLLLSGDPANQNLAVTMLEQGGVPDGLLEAMLVVMQHPKSPPKVRKALGALAEAKLPSFPKLVKTVLGGTSLFLSGATKLTDRIVLLEKNSKGALSGGGLARALLKFERDDDDDGGAPRVLLYALESGDETLAREVFDHATRRGKLNVGWLEARAGAALARVPKGVATERITEMAIDCVKLKEIPPFVLGLREVRSLSAENNELKTLPAGFSNLAKLETLHLSDNSFAVFPEVLFSLPHLRVLEMGQSERKPRLRGVPETIAKLRSITHLVLAGQSLGSLPDSLGTLPALEELDLSGATMTHLPAALATAPKLTVLSLEHAKIEDAASKKSVVAKLKARGVTIR